MTSLVRSAPVMWAVALCLSFACLCAAAGPTVRGAGATFASPIFSRWAADYQLATGVAVSYAAVGSGAGVGQMAQRLVDFGATDIALTAAERQRIGVLQFPAVIGGVVPVFNVSGIGSPALRLTGQVLGDIYLGRIRRWNDRAITDLNPGLDLPSANITVVHRSDASGTTHLWSEFLSRSNRQWRATVGAGKLLDWPVGVADAGNDGVASSVQRTRWSIGYVEYAYAKQHRLSIAAVQNRAGVFVIPDPVAFEAALSSADWRSAADLDRWLLDQGGAASWPMVGATYILLPNRPQEVARTLEARRFFDWALRHGQQSAADLDYVALPARSVDLIESTWPEPLRSSVDGHVSPETAKTAPLHGNR